MPGIVGFVMREEGEKELNRIVLKKMTRRMRYFDWFTEKSYCDKFAGMGKIGLGDKYGKRVLLKEGKQVIFCEGEIFSFGKYKKLQNGMETIPGLLLTLFSKKGERFIEELNGAFVIAMWDREKKQLLILNDRYGLRPLYYTFCDGIFLFSSEIKGMLDFPGFNKKVDDRAVCEFFSFGYPLGNKTFFEDVRLLSPGSILTFRDGSIKIRKYWDFSFQEEYEQSIKEEQYIEKLSYLLKIAIERRFEAKNLRVGSFLSGGLDTRTILALKPNGQSHIHTFTHETGQPYDVVIAETISKRIGTFHHFLFLERDYISKYAKELVWVNEGASDATCGHLFSILDEIKNFVDIIIDGTSGDMIMGSFVKKEFFSLKSDALLNFIYGNINYPYSESELGLLYKKGYHKKIECIPYESFISEFKKIPLSYPANRFDYFILQNKLRRWLFSGLVNIRSRIEVRSPFYDYDLIDFVLTIPPKLRLNQYLYKRYLLRCFPALASLPQGNGVPVKVNIVKKPFFWLHRKVGKKIKGKRIDFAALLRNESRGFIKTILLDERTLERGYFEVDFIKRIIDEHMEKRENHTAKLTSLVTFELWNRMFVDGEVL